MACQGIFVTGTDTGVGKTVIAGALLRLLARDGRRVVGLKPVASGAECTTRGLRNGDALVLAAESSVRLAYELTNPFCFEPPVAPNVAAAESRRAIDLCTLVRWYETATDGCDAAVVEGAGGWRLPLHPQGFLSDLPEHLRLGIVLVVGLKLGCLNHACLTVEAIDRAGRCPLLGWIGNSVDPGFARLDDNIATLSRVLGRPPLAVVPHMPDPVAASVVRHLEGAARTIALRAPA